MVIIIIRLLAQHVEVRRLNGFLSKKAIQYLFKGHPVRQQHMRYSCKHYLTAIFSTLISCEARLHLFIRYKPNITGITSSDIKFHTNAYWKRTCFALTNYSMCII